MKISFYFHFNKLSNHWNIIFQLASSKYPFPDHMDNPLMVSLIMLGMDHDDLLSMIEFALLHADLSII